MSRPATWLAAAVAAVLVLGLLTGSARDPRGELAQAAEFEQVYRAAWGWLDGERNEQGTSYKHAAIRGPDDGERVGENPGPGSGFRDPRSVPRPDLYSSWVQGEEDWVRVGRGGDLSTYHRRRLASGEPIFAAVLLPPRSNTQFALVGERLRRPMLVPPYPKSVVPDAQQRFEPLVNTPFIAFQTYFEAGWDPCQWSPLMDMCQLDRAWRATRAAVPGLPMLVERNAEGAPVARTGIRVIDLIKIGPILPGGRDITQLLPVGAQLIPFEIELRPDGALAAMRLHGAVSTPTVNLAVQIGIDISGPADITDIPATPNDPTQYTVMQGFETANFTSAASSFYDSPATYQPDWRPDLPPLPLRATGPAVVPPQ